jgi:hypothetical protein
MLRVRTICSALCALSLAMAFLPIAKAKAQTVDPCSYGCPKQGCGCPNEGGGPIGK